MDVLSIGQLAEAVGVNVETVRYYERRGLLAEPPRSAAGYRQYTVSDVWRLQFIARAKSLGFTLNEIRELAGERGDASAERTLAAARAKLDSVDEELSSLAEMRSRLERLVDTCAGGAEVDCTSLNLVS